MHLDIDVPAININILAFERSLSFDGHMHVRLHAVHHHAGEAESASTRTAFDFVDLKLDQINCASLPSIDAIDIDIGDIFMHA